MARKPLPIKCFGRLFIGKSLRVYPGRISSIDFSGTDEIITYIGLGDSSKLVFNTDLPIESGSAKTIFLRPIQTLKFPGATVTKITNLVVKTRTEAGISRLYNFNLVHSQGTPANLGVQIVAQVRQAKTSKASIQIGNGRSASLDDLERGLQIAISRGYTSASDPVVYDIKRLTAIARNQDLSIVDAAQASGVDLAVIDELVEMALESSSKPVAIEQGRSENIPKLASKPNTSAPLLQKTKPAESSNNDRAKAKETRSDKEQLPSVPQDRSKLEDVNKSKSAPAEIRKLETKQIQQNSPISLANDLVYGLGIAQQKGQINYGTQTYKQINTVIFLIRRGETLEKATAKAKVPKSVIEQVLKWGQLRASN